MTAKTERYFLGLTSGYSVDGVAAVLAAVCGQGEHMAVRQVRYEFTPYPPALRRTILAAATGETITAAGMAELDRDVGLAMAAAAKKLINAARVARRKLIAVGSGGQALAYVPPTDAAPIGGRLHIGAPAIIAEAIGLPVVADFAAADLAAGGRGGPVSAWPDWVLFGHQRKTRVVVHLGAVASITFCPAGGQAGDTLTFDAGPGTLVIDALTRRLFDKPCDTDGAIAAAATADPSLLNELLADPYLHRRPPKTTGPERWGAAYMDRLGLMADKRDLTGAGRVATASELTIRSIVAAIGEMTENPHEVLLAGGGAKNIHLAMGLRKLLVPASTISTERFDIDSKALAALGCAMLAAARIDGVRTGMPQVTGAGRATLMGNITDV